MCYALFGNVCGSKFSNLARSLSIEMIEPATGTTLNGECDAMCCAVFGNVCGSKFSKLAKCSSIEMVEPTAGTLLNRGCDAICWLCLVMLQGLHQHLLQCGLYTPLPIPIRMGLECQNSGRISRTKHKKFWCVLHCRPWFQTKIYTIFTQESMRIQLDWSEFPKKEIIYHPMWKFLGIKNILIMWSMLVSLLSKLQNTEKIVTHHNSDITTVIPHLMQNFLGIKNVPVMWPDDWIDWNFWKSKWYLFRCGFFWTSRI